MPSPIGATDPSRNQSSLDDCPNQSTAASPPAKAEGAATSAALEGGYTSSDGSTRVSRDAVNQLVASASKKPARPAPQTTERHRSVPQCGDKALKSFVVCGSGLAATLSAAPTAVGAFVAGAAAGVACAEAYFEYVDCLEGKK